MAQLPIKAKFIPAVSSPPIDSLAGRVFELAVEVIQALYMHEGGIGLSGRPGFFPSVTHIQRLMFPAGLTRRQTGNVFSPETGSVLEEPWGEM